MLGPNKIKQDLLCGLPMKIPWTLKKLSEMIYYVGNIRVGVVC